MKMIISRLLCVVCLSLVLVGTAFAESDIAGSRDHPLFNRLPGFYIQQYQDEEFGSHAFRDKKFREFTVEGHLYHIVYQPKTGVKAPSALQIHRNYENAIRKIGGTVTFGNDEYSFMHLVRDGREIWVELTVYGVSPGLYIVEKQAMKQEIVANADVFADDIKSTGHAAVYGIYFDTGKAIIKPESDAALGEIAKLLKSRQGMKVNIVGHTDNVGRMDSNMKLSQARADAVMKALTGKYNIAAGRLKAYGVSSLSPVASNRTEEGRAKNRRVELVEQ